MKKVNPRNLSDLSALAPIQQGMLAHYLRNPESLHYVEKLTISLRGNIDLHSFNQAWAAVIEANPALRTFFQWEKLDTPVQVTLKNRSYQPRYRDLTQTGPETKIQEAPEFLNLEDVPFHVFLDKIADSQYEMILLHHHILIDGWSIGIILREFFSSYNALRRNKPPVIQSKRPYSIYLKWLKKRNLEEEKKFWQTYLSPYDDGPPHALLTPPESTLRIGTESVIYIRHTLGFKESIERFIKTRQITLSTMLYYAWGVLLRIYLNSDDVLFGSTISGRNISVEDVRNMVGLFVNTIPLRLRRIPGETIALELKRFQHDIREREPYEHTPLTDIGNWRHSGIEPATNEYRLFDTIVVVENYPVDPLSMSADGLITDGYKIRESTPYPLTLVVTTGEINGESGAGEVKLTFISDREEFSANTLKRMALHMTAILEQIIRYPQRETNAIDILSSEEKQQLLFTYNDTRVRFPGQKCIHLLFEDRAQRVPRYVAVSGSSTDGASSHLTYRELDRAANQLASRLLEKGVTPGNDIVALLNRRSVEMVVAIMGILKAGTAYLPIDPLYPKERIKYMLDDSGVRLVLTCPFDEKPAAAHVQYLDIGSLTCGSGRGTRDKDAATPSLYAAPAYAIYTSGTTGRPKGVLVDHSALVNLILHLQNAFPLGTGDSYLFKTNYCFDVSLTELFGWFPGGGRLSIPADNVEKEPALLVKAIKNRRITHINFVPSMFNLFVQYLTPADGTRLSSLKFIFLAGEALYPTPVEQLRRVRPGFSPRVENLYGPTEATIYASGYSLSSYVPAQTANPSIPIGKPLSNVRLYITGRDGRLQPDGLAGELCIGGAGLALGYLNYPQLTAQKFVSPHPSWSCTGMERIRAHLPPRVYKTGDLVRRLPDGNIQFMGRLDHQVKIRGFRIELGEIEHCLTAQEVVKDARVIADQQQLCAYIVPHSQGIPHHKLEVQFRKGLSITLPDYMIPAHFIFLERLPLTLSGKLDRSSLPRPAAAATRDNYIPPADSIEKALVEIWSGILDLEPCHISREANFFHLGGHSLNAIPMLSRIHKTMNVQVPLSMLFAFSILRQLAQYIRSLGYTGSPPAAPIAAIEKKEYYPLSAEQKRIFIIEQMENLGTSYNLPVVLEMRGDINRRGLKRIFNALINRHEAFRTSFDWNGSEAVQTIRDSVSCTVEQFHIGTSADELEAEIQSGCLPDPVLRLIEGFIRPFDFSKAPLLRVGWLLIREGYGILMVDIHHIIADGISLDILHREVKDLYREQSPPPLAVTYKDYTAWCNGPERRKAMETQACYWLDQYSNPAPPLELPFDFPRPPKRDFRGGSHHFTLSPEFLARLSDLADAEEVTLFMLLLALFTVFLAKLCDQEDIVVGVPSAGRNHDDLESVIGMFVNTLALRNQPQYDLSFTDFLHRLKDNTLKAFDNNDYQFQELVERLNITRDPGRNPLFDAVFSFRAAGGRPAAGPGQLTLKTIQFERHITHFDLMLFVLETNEGLDLNFEYSSSLFKPSTISRFQLYFEEITGQIIEDNHITIKNIKLSHHMVAISSNDILDEEGDFGF